MILLLCLSTPRNFLFISLQTGVFMPVCCLCIQPVWQSVKISCLFLLCDKHGVFLHLSHGWSLWFPLKCFDTPWNHTTHRNNYLASLLFVPADVFMCTSEETCSYNRHKHCAAACICTLYFVLRYGISSVITCCQSIGISGGKQISSFHCSAFCTEPRFTLVYFTGLHSYDVPFCFLCKLLDNFRAADIIIFCWAYIVA